jgi:hypothetical protein
MKKYIALLLVLALLVCLTACKSKQAEEPEETASLADLVPEAEAAAQAEAESQAPAEEAAQPEPQPAEEPVVTPEELVGTWKLSGDNDMEALEAVFPEAGELGGVMEIGMDGLMFWYIGTFGGAGNFTVDDNVLNVQIYPDTGAPEPAVCTADFDADTLTMDYKGVSIVWVQD